jgi:hydroxymethylglutaryl-CoA synthase
MFFNDYLANPDAPKFESIPKEFAQLEKEKTFTDKAVEKAFIAVAKEHYKKSVWPGTDCVRRCGNMYTASLYGGLAALLANVSSEELVSARYGRFISMSNYRSFSPCSKASE